MPDHPVSGVEGPDWDDAKLCHERWHTTLRLIDDSEPTTEDETGA
jgi:hypothetical protein